MCCAFLLVDVMRLKRVVNRASPASKSKDKKTDAIISRYASGTSLSFNTRDSNMCALFASRIK